MSFRCFFRTGSVLAEIKSVGQLFQRRGAATPKARSPAVDRRDRRTISLFDAADLSRVLELSSHFKTLCSLMCKYLLTSFVLHVSDIKLRQHTSQKS